MTTPVVRTTLALPADLAEQIDRAVRAGKARSRNAFVVAALRREFAAAEAAAIAADLAGMAEDAEYQAEALALAEEAVAAGWEALRIAESRQ
jgi:hypothetical protein